MNEMLAVWSCFGFVLAFLAFVLAIVAIVRSRGKASPGEDAGRLDAIQEKLEQLNRRLQRVERQLGPSAEVPPKVEPEWRQRLAPKPETAPPMAPPVPPATAPPKPGEGIFAAPPPPLGMPAAHEPPPARPAVPLAPGSEPEEFVPLGPAESPAPAAASIALPPAVSVPPSDLAGVTEPPKPVAPPPAAPPPRPPLRPPKPPAPEREGGWERRLGILIPVWIGAVALILAGAFLVKYGVEHGWLGPTARVFLATLLGTALLVAGELIRKKTPAAAQGASAAGVAVLYAAFLGATILYHLVSPWVGFTLLALTTAAAVALSLRQGIIVAFLGLVGGFFTPFWIGVISASPARLFAYLLMLQGGLLIVTRKRQWNGLAALTLIMGLGAVLYRAFEETVLADAPWIGLFVIASTAAFVYAAKKWKDSKPVGGGTDWEVAGAVPVNALLGYLALLGAFLGLAVLAVQTRFGLMEWGFFGILSLASIVLGRLDSTYSKLPWVGFAVTLLLAAGWVVQSKPHEVTNIWIVCAGMALLFGLGGYVAHQGSKFPASWATLSAAGGLAAFGLAWWADKLHGLTISHWGTISLGLALAYLAASVAGAQTLRRQRYGEASLAAFCVATTSFVSFAVPLELERHWITVAWAVETAALAWLLSKLRVKALGVLGLILTAGVAVRFLLNPEVFDYPLGTNPVFNWILYGYGLSAAALALAAFWYDRAGWAPASAGVTWVSGALLFYLLTLQVRHGFHPTGLSGSFPKVVEWATYSHLWILAGVLLLAAHLKWKRLAVGLLGLAFLAVSAFKITLFDLLVANPLWNHDSVGDALVLNWVLYAFGIPVLLLAIAGWILEQTGWRISAGITYAYSGLVGLALLALEVRQGFHGADLEAGRTTLVEWGTYSVAWLAAGLLMLLASRQWRRPVLSYMGTAFFVVAAVKVLSVDLFAANPVWNHHDVGEWPFFNWLLYVYGVPALLLALFKPALPLDAGRVRSAAGFFKACSILASFVLVSLLVRQFFHGSYLDVHPFSLLEVSTYGHAWFLMAGVLIAWGARDLDDVFLWGGRALYGLALLKLLLADVLFLNPYLWHQDVGSFPVLNWLLYVYGVPILILALLSRTEGGEGWPRVSAAVSLYAGLFLGLVLITLEVRQFFHPNFLDQAPIVDMENYAYSAAWILFALLLLALGIAKGVKAPRVASLVVILLAVAKVFIYDLRHLEDLYRVGSFLALGISLLLISFLYQRFVFREVSRD